MKKLLETTFAPIVLIACTGPALGFQIGLPDPGTEFFQTVFQTDFAVGGVGGMRGVGGGVIMVSGVTGPVTQAYLYWHGPERPIGAEGNTSVSLDGAAVVGTSIGVSDDNCWQGFSVSRSYRADVTDLLQASCEGTFTLTGFGTSTGSGANPRVGTNGASLIVFYDDGDPSNDRDVVMYDGNDSNVVNNFDGPNWNVLLSGIDYTSGAASLELHVADGQSFRDFGLTLNNQELAPAGAVFQGTSVPSANPGPTGDGSLWDILTYDVTSFLQVGTNNLRLQSRQIPDSNNDQGGNAQNNPRDCVSLVVAIFDLPAGSAPGEPEPGNTPPLCGVDLGDVEPGFNGCLDIIINAGQLFSVDFVGVDSDEDDVLTLSASGVPAAAALMPLPGTSDTSPFPATLDWIPSDADALTGPHEISVTYTDIAGESSTCHLSITVNRVPVCVVAGAPEISTECTSPDGALVTLDGNGSSDPDGDSLGYTWFVSDTDVTLADPNAPVTEGMFPVGVTMATLVVADGRGGVACCDVCVIVQDTTPPEVMCTTSKAMLWPPKHKMVDVTLTILATDACADPEFVFPIMVTVSSDEPDDGDGDGSTTGDVHGADGFTSPVVVSALPTSNAGEYVAVIQLRAERDGGGDGRKYTIDVTALDSGDNEATTSCCVVVPHDKGK